MMMFRSTTASALLLALLAVAPFAESAQLKIATLAPDGSYWMNEVRRGGEEIERRTEGRVKLRIYPGGTMGNDQAMLRKIRIGQLHGAMVISSALANIDPDIQLYGMPLIFRSYDEVDHVRKKLDATLVKGLEAQGHISFGIIEGGFAYILSVDPTTTFEDLKGRRAWVPAGDSVARTILEKAGMSPVPLPLSDVLTGLQTRLIDTVAGPPVGAVALQWFTKAKYFTDWPILYSYGSIVISAKALGKLGKNDEAVVRDVLGRVSRNLDKRTRLDNQSAREALAKQGVRFVDMTADAARKWQEVADEANAELGAKEGVSADLITQLRHHLDAYRKQQVAASEG